MPKTRPETIKAYQVFVGHLVWTPQGVFPVSKIERYGNRYTFQFPQELNQPPVSKFSMQNVLITPDTPSHKVAH